MEMKLAFILTTLVSWSMGQKIIYPDEFATMLAASPRPIPQSNPALSKNNNAFDNPSSIGYNQFSPSPPQAAPDRNNQQPLLSTRSPVNNVISNGVLRFALNVDDAVAVSRSRYVPGSHDNVIFSPLSVAATLALVLLGSATRTFDEVSAILGLDTLGLDFSRNSELIHQQYGALISGVHGVPGLSTPEVSFANGIFVRNGYPIRTEYEAAARNIYNSEVINLDYEFGGGNAQRMLNTWVNNKTRGKIPTILNEPPSPDTSVIIASALYFNGEWNQHFIEGSTRRKMFTVGPGETVNVDMMYNGGEFPFYEDRQLGTKIVGLPYKGRDVTMYVLLPTDKSYEALRSLERRLNTDTLENLIRNMRNQTCILGLPRMKLSSTLSLRDALQSLGLNSLFNPATADLSLISAGSSVNSRFKEDGVKDDGNKGDGTKDNGFKQVASNRQNYFTYDDTVRGFHVEQWATGFSIGRIRPQRRRRSFNLRKSLLERSAVSKDEEKPVKIDLEEDTVEGKGSEEKLQRNRRQSAQQINQDFYNAVDNSNQQTYGLDYLRNNIPLTNPRLYADDVLHRVEIDITEKGTEAAAATSVILTKDGSQKRLIADHPFLFFIRHEPTGLILFWGSVNKPTPNFAS